MTRIRLDQLQAELARRNRPPSAADHYAPSPWRRQSPVAVTARAVSLAELEAQLSGPKPGKEAGKDLVRRWLQLRWPAFAFADNPIEPSYFPAVHAAARPFSSWAKSVIFQATQRHNTSHRAQVTLATAGSMWRRLDGAPLRPVTDVERERARREVVRLDAARTDAMEALARK